MTLRPVTLLLFAYVAFAAITQPLTSEGDAVERNPQGTWCYYPRANPDSRTACLGPLANFQAVLNVHLNQTISISYYNAALTRVGGTEWPLPTSTQEKFYLCLSGKAGDGSFETSCENAQKDNVIHRLARCVVALGQREVSDGCYVPAQLQVNSSGTLTVLPSGSGTASSATPDSTTVNAAPNVIVFGDIKTAIAMITAVVTVIICML